MPVAMSHLLMPFAIPENPRYIKKIHNKNCADL
jgi:hypothetical protein